MKNQIVVSRFREDIKWLKHLIENDWVEHILVYNKGYKDIGSLDSRLEIINVPNTGREGGTYLDYIISNYEHLPERVWFLQADPFTHSPDFLHLMKKECVDLYQNKMLQGLTDRWMDSHNVPPIQNVEITNAWNVRKKRCVKYFLGRDLQPVGHCLFHDSGMARTVDCFLKFYGDKHLLGHLADVAGLPRPKNITEFYYSACFYVHRDAILSNPKSSYENLKQFLLESNDQGSFQGYILERFWFYLFEKRSFDVLTDCYKDVIKNKYIAVYCHQSKRIWIKENIIKYISQAEPNNILYEDQGEIKILPNLNFHGPDLYSESCETLQDAKTLLKNFIDKN